MTRYYYAGGRRVELEVDEEHVAVDQQRAEAAGLRAEVERVTKGAPRLPGGVVLASRDAIDATQLSSLRTAGALLPVFRRDRALVVPLPEVRVEFDNARQRRAVTVAIKQLPHPVHVAEDDPDRMVLEPTSGSGDEAMAVANYVFEHAHPAAASVRFVQFVPKPETRRKA